MVLGPGLAIFPKASTSADTRQIGAIPMITAHRTAYKRAEIRGFRIHDWCHHIAVWVLKPGPNLRALRQIASWTLMRVVQRGALFAEWDLDGIIPRTAADDLAPPSD